MNLGEAEFPQGEFISPEDFKSMGPPQNLFRGEIKGKLVSLILKPQA